MPFVSDAQRRYMYAKHPRIAARWSEHTPKGKDLPEHVKKAVEDLIAGGKAQGMPASDFDPKQIEMGKKVEREHTPDPAKAEEIAKDHLEEFGNYYSALKKMEDKLTAGKTAAYRLGSHHAVLTLV
jgi:hypothetical protein